MLRAPSLPPAGHPLTSAAMRLDSCQPPPPAWTQSLGECQRTKSARDGKERAWALARSDQKHHAAVGKPSNFAQRSQHGQFSAGGGQARPPCLRTQQAAAWIGRLECLHVGEQHAALQLRTQRRRAAAAGGQRLQEKSSGCSRWAGDGEAWSG